MIYLNMKEYEKLWSMCYDALKLVSLTVEYAESKKLTDLSYYLDFEDALNILSCKDHTKQDIEFKKIIDEFKAGPK